MKRQLLLALTGLSLLTGGAYAKEKPVAKDKALVANVVDDDDDAKPAKGKNVYFKNCTAARAASPSCGKTLVRFAAMVRIKHTGRCRVPDICPIL